MGQASSSPSSTSSPSSSSSSARNRRGADSSDLASQSPQSSPSTTAHIGSNITHHISDQTYPLPPQQQQQEQQHQPRPQQPPSSSRVLRSTTERRRRANLFSSFYPLLSRSYSNTSINGDNTVSESSQGQDVPSSSSSHRPDPSPIHNTSIGYTGVSESSAGGSSISNRSTERPPSRTGTTVAGTYGLIPRSLTRSPAIQTSSSSSGGRTPRGLSRVQRLYDEQSISSTRSSSRGSSFVATGPYTNPSVNVTPSANMSVEDMDIDSESVGVNPQEQQFASEQEWPFTSDQEQPSMSEQDQPSMSEQEQPSMSEQEQPLVTEHNPEEDIHRGDDTLPESGADRSQLLLSQLPFVMRFLAEFSQGIRPGTEGNTENSEGTQSNENVSQEGAEPGNEEAQSASGDGSERTPESTPDTATPSTGTNAPPRRHHTTIRFIQIGGGPGSGSRHRQGATASASDQEGGEGEPRDDQAVHTGETVGEAVIMFLTGPATDSQSDSDSNDSAEHEGLDGPESTGPRRRQRSPWVVMTFSGAYINSLMAAGAGGEGGANYDDLWMLSNLIGPARPITTTQEAIDGAGFSIGRFENAVQGIRNITTLGDGAKCLVCMSEYEEGEEMRALKCKHGFHLECIDKWLTTGANKCPVCRTTAVVMGPPPVGPEVSTLSAASEE